VGGVNGNWVLSSNWGGGRKRGAGPPWCCGGVVPPFIVIQIA